MDELSGIERAIRAAGTQAHLSFLASQASGQTISQGRISDWRMRGYVPADRAPVIAKVSGIPLEDLLRKPKTKRKALASG